MVSYNYKTVQDNYFKQTLGIKTALTFLWI